MKMKFIFICFPALCAAFASCATIDVERGLRSQAAGRVERIEDLPPSVRVDPEIRIVERPVYVPEGDAPGQPPSGYDAVYESNRAGIIRPSDYSHAAVVYDYDPDWVYEAYAQPLRVCDIVLEPGEQAVEAPYVSDSVRWQLGAGVSYEGGAPVQHIYVKPTDPDISASLIINTDRRVYRLLLRSYKSVYMPLVRWRYHAGAMPGSYIAPFAHEKAEAGPRFLSFGYRVTYSWFRKPAWLPEMVFDDGARTYIAFPEAVHSRELPAVFENRRDVLNYRVEGSIIVIDKLVESATVKIGRDEVAVEKKKAKGIHGRRR